MSKVHKLEHSPNGIAIGYTRVDNRIDSSIIASGPYNTINNGLYDVARYRLSDHYGIMFYCCMCCGQIYSWFQILTGLIEPEYLYPQDLATLARELFGP